MQTWLIQMKGSDDGEDIVAIADIDHVEVQVALGAIVKGVGTAALEVPAGNLRTID